MYPAVTLASDEVARISSDLYSTDELRQIKRKSHSGPKQLSPSFLFLFGSILYVALACWDILISRTSKSASTFYHSTSTACTSWYALIAAAAAACYILNACVLVYKMRAPSTLRFLIHASKNHESVDRYENRLDVDDLFTYTYESDLLGSVETPKFPNTYESTKYEVALWYAGIAFGLGAVCYLLSALSGARRLDRSRGLADVMDLVGSVLYLICAVLLVANRSCQTETAKTGLSVLLVETDFLVKSTPANAIRTQLLGDYLFLVASTASVLLSYMTLVATSLEDLQIIYLGNFSAALIWLIDAIVYLAAEIFLSNEMQEQEQVLNESSSGSGSTMTCTSNTSVRSFDSVDVERMEILDDTVIDLITITTTKRERGIASESIPLLQRSNTITSYSWSSNCKTKTVVAV